jgi:predicted  nucleic acid-binding Zn-ribbon protein
VKKLFRTTVEERREHVDKKLDEVETRLHEISEMANDLVEKVAKMEREGTDKDAE